MKLTGKSLCVHANLLVLALLCTPAFADQLYDNGALGAYPSMEFGRSNRGYFDSQKIINVLADDFMLTETATIDRVNFIGLYAFTTMPDDFSIFFYEDTGAGPGALIESFHVGGNVNRVDTGINSSFIGVDIFQYEANFSGFTAVAGQSYYIEVSNNIMGAGWEWGADFVPSASWRIDDREPWEPANILPDFQLYGTPVPGPSSPETITVFRGIELSGTITDFESSDDVRAVYNPGFVLTNVEAPVWLIFDGVAPSATEFLVESQAGTPGLTYTVEAFDFTAGALAVIGTQAEVFDVDQVATFPITADNIDAGGEVQTRVGWRQTGFTINFPWEVRVDQVSWNQ